MQHVINNDYVDATMAGLFVAVVVAMTIFGVISLARALRNKAITSTEVGAFVAPIPEPAHV